jgi:hypothetical protein
MDPKHESLLYRLVSKATKMPWLMLPIARAWSPIGFTSSRRIKI